MKREEPSETVTPILKDDLAESEGVNEYDCARVKKIVKKIVKILNGFNKFIKRFVLNPNFIGFLIDTAYLTQKCCTFARVVYMILNLLIWSASGVV